MLAAMTDEPALKCGLTAHQKRRAFRSERVAASIVTCQKVEADQGIHNRAEPAFGRPANRADFLDRLRPRIQCVEHAILNRRLQHKWRHITPGKLHDAFRRNRSSGSGHNRKAQLYRSPSIRKPTLDRKSTRL